MRSELIKTGLRLSTALLVLGVLLLAPSYAKAQEQSGTNGGSSQVAENNTAATTPGEKAPPKPMPLFTNYRGITIGMSAEEVRQKLDHLKEKGDKQDLFVFSDRESAQVYYDDKGMVQAVSVDYKGNQSGAPEAMAVLGENPPAKADGTVYQLVRYPEAKYWVSYSRTPGDSPVVSVTMQKMP